MDKFLLLSCVVLCAFADDGISLDKSEKNVNPVFMVYPMILGSAVGAVLVQLFYPLK
eukprot:UN23493